MVNYSVFLSAYLTVFLSGLFTLQLVGIIGIFPEKIYGNSFQLLKLFNLNSPKVAIYISLIYLNIYDLYDFKISSYTLIF